MRAFAYERPSSEIAAVRAASALAQLLFGETFDVSNASDIDLAFHHGNYWILRAGKRISKNAEIVCRKSLTDSKWKRVCTKTESWWKAKASRTSVG